MILLGPLTGSLRLSLSLRLPMGCKRPGSLTLD